MMSGVRYSPEERLFMVKTFYETKNYSEVLRRFKNEFGDEKKPKPDTVKTAVEKFETNFTILDNLAGNVGPKLTVLTDRNIKKVQDFYEAHPTISVRRVAA